MPQKVLITLFLFATLLLTHGSVLTQAAEPGETAKVAAQTITSKLEMTVWIDKRQHIGKTPGTLEIPPCTRRIFDLTGLTEQNVKAYIKELDRLQVRHVILDRLTNTQLKTYVSAGLFKDTTTLYLQRCDALTDIAPLVKLQSLTTLALFYCKELKDITPLAKLQNLATLDLSNCEGLTDLTPLAKLSNLNTLYLGSCEELTDLTPLAKLSNLDTLDLSNCERLTDIAPLSALRKLTGLCLQGCSRLRDIQSLAWLPNLQYLNLFHCKKINSFYPLSGHKKLEGLYLTIPDNNLAFLRNLKQLRVLHFRECPKLTNVAPLGNLQNLEVLLFEYCSTITQASLDELNKKLPKSCEVTLLLREVNVLQPRNRQKGSR